MRIIGMTLLLAISPVVSLAQTPAVQQTGNSPQANDPSVGQSTGNQPLPRTRLGVLDVAQLQIDPAAPLQNQNPDSSAERERLRSQGIESVPETRLVIKDGAIYLRLTNDTLLPMNGGGASGCVPENPKNSGRLVTLSAESRVNQAPAKDPLKKN